MAYNIPQQQAPQQGAPAPQPGGAPQMSWGPQGVPTQPPQPVQGQPQFETPHPTVQYGQNLPTQTPPQQAPVGSQPQGGRTQVDPNAVLDGPAVPTELRGRTFAQAMRIYGALANDWLQRQNGQPNPQQLAGQAPPR